MTLVYSGAISLGAIADEFGSARSNVSLRDRSSAAGKGTPDAMSEFYGYTAPTTTFTHPTMLWGPTSKSSTAVITTYKSNVVVTLTVFGGIVDGGSCSGSYFVSGVTTISVLNRTRYDTGTATMTIPTPGTRTATITITPYGQGTSSAAFSKVTAA